ncbi:hypothetical protein Tco_1185518 [Tanacetum coccineum]
MHTFNQPQDSEYRWTKDHPLTQVRGNPSKPVQTRRQLATDPEMCMFALTVSNAEPKNIKEAMADSAWIEVMQEELYQFDRLQVWELVDKPFGKNVINLKWLWKNKKDEDQTVIRNKARLVAKGGGLRVIQPDGFVDPNIQRKLFTTKESSIWINTSFECLVPSLGLGIRRVLALTTNQPFQGAWTHLPDAFGLLAKALNVIRNTFPGDKLVSWMSKERSYRTVLQCHSHEADSQAVNKSPTHYPCDSARTFRVILFSIHNDEWKSFQCHHQTALRRPYALSWKPCQGDSLNLPDHRIHKDGDGDASFQLKSDSLPHAHAQTTKTFYKHQDSRIMKAQELKTKTSAQTLIYKIFLQRYQVYQGRLLASFQDDAKYEHVGQDTRSQGGKDDQDGRIKI